LAVVRPMDGVLVMAMLNYDAEMRKPETIKSEFTRARTTPRKQHLAEDLVTKWQDNRFEFSSYKDRYQQKVKQAIEAKEKGLPVDAPEEEEPEVINLMEALQRSVAGVSGRKSHKPSGGKRKRTTSRRKVRRGA